MSAAQPIIAARGLTKRFGALTAVRDVSLDVREGELFALLGPSGCGKSTLLRMIAGFETADAGQLLLDGKEMGHRPPHQRPVNMVFQSYAVFPHMSVEKNVAYGLQRRGLGRDEIAERVDRALERLRMAHLKTRRPNRLSGGEKQRVALARALVLEPRVLLLDEPLSALDAKLRDAMRLELVSLQRTIGISFVMVTHDQSEALAMADRIAVMERGRLRQVASPTALYHEPADAFVADFIGRINLFDITAIEVEEGRTAIETAQFGRLVCEGPIRGGALDRSGPMKLALRPESIAISAERPHEGALVAEGRLDNVAFQGNTTLAEIALSGEGTLAVCVHDRDAALLMSLERGARLFASWQAESMLLLPTSADPQ